jgi:hypothetical protein
MPQMIENVDQIVARVRFVQDNSNPTGWTRFAHVFVTFELKGDIGLPGTHPLDGLQIYSQMDDKHHDITPYVYGESVRYIHVFTLEQLEAERKAKFLKWMNTRMGNLYKRFGPYNTYSQYVMRVLDVLGVKQVVMESPMHVEERMVREDVIHYRVNELAYPIDSRCNDKALNWDGVRWSDDK